MSTDDVEHVLVTFTDDDTGREKRRHLEPRRFASWGRDEAPEIAMDIMKHWRGISNVKLVEMKLKNGEVVPL